jgi:hypothetical protein
MKNYIVKYAEVGPDAGPFTITDSTGAVVATGVTRAQLLAGYMVSINDTATGITVTSASPCGNSTVLEIPTAIGYYNYPGTTHKLTWVNNFQDLATSSSAAGNATLGALAGYTIIQSASLATTGVLTVAGPSTTLGPFNGGGKVILTGSNSSTSGTVVESGAELQLGVGSKTGTTGSISGSMNVQGVLNMYGAYTAATQPTGLMTVGSTGVVNIEGPDINGQGYINTGSVIGAVGSTVNIKNSFTAMSNGPMNGTVNVLDGATLKTGAISGTVNLNSCTGGFYDSANVQHPNIEFTGSGYTGGTINVGTCGGSLQGSSNISGTVTGSGPLQIGFPGEPGIAGLNFTGAGFTGTATVYGSQIRTQPLALENAQVRVGAATNFYPFGGGGTTVQTYIRSLQSAADTATTGKLYMLNGPLTIKNQDPEPYYGTFQGNGVDVLTVQAGNFQIAATAATGNIPMVLSGNAKVGGYGAAAVFGGPLTVSTAAGGLSLVTNLSKLAVTAFTASNGFTVDIGAAYAGAAGTYTILTKTSGSSAIPTVGANASGLTPTFSWSGNNLVMVLAP